MALAAEVLDEARSRGLTVGTAESCTGGLVEGSLTAVPGSSDVVKGAIGSYACSVKHAVLGVSDEILDTVGPVSPECAAAMAEGARTALGCDLSVSVTGIAGPGGAEPGKPVGLVWFGVSSGAGTRTESVVFPGDRSEVRLRAVRHALQLLRD
nr:CinA family protein [uncultured Parolsenella sp.]